MFRIRDYGKFAVAAAALAGVISLSQPAAAAPHHWGHHPGWGYHHRGWGPRFGPVFYPGPHCFVRRFRVWGPYGWHVVVRRVCR